eukprot:1284475-Prorocentrum_lima.AAC.1
MTSSLVGSEMCIRDRQWAQQQHDQHCDPVPGQACHERGHVPDHRGLPVSYTHLTLPTICSV